MKNLKTMWATTKAASVENAATSKKVKGFYAIAGAGALGMVATSAIPSVLAAGDTMSNIANAFKEMFKKVYAAMLAVVTAIATILCAICLIMRMTSKNPKTAEEATQWIKRIIITWLCFMLLSVFVNFAMEIVNQSGANTTSPWGA